MRKNDSCVPVIFLALSLFIAIAILGVCIGRLDSNRPRSAPVAQDKGVWVPLGKGLWMRTGDGKISPIPHWPD